MQPLQHLFQPAILLYAVQPRRLQQAHQRCRTMPCNDRANSHVFRPITTCRIARSHRLLSSGIAPSSTNRLSSVLLECAYIIALCSAESVAHRCSCDVSHDHSASSCGFVYRCHHCRRFSGDLWRIFFSRLYNPWIIFSAIPTWRSLFALYNAAKPRRACAQ